MTRGIVCLPLSVGFSLLYCPRSGFWGRSSKVKRSRAGNLKSGAGNFHCHYHIYSQLASQGSQLSFSLIFASLMWSLRTPPIVPRNPFQSIDSIPFQCHSITQLLTQNDHLTKSTVQKAQQSHLSPSHLTDSTYINLTQSN